MEMPPSRNLKDIKVSNGMKQLYSCFIKIFELIMAPITKLTCKSKAFEWIIECHKAWEKNNV
jgi:hypothetical protein